MEATGPKHKVLVAYSKDVIHLSKVALWDFQITGDFFVINKGIIPRCISEYSLDD